MGWKIKWRKHVDYNNNIFSQFNYIIYGFLLNQLRYFDNLFFKTWQINNHRKLIS